MNKNLITIALALALGACGSSSDSDEKEVAPVNSPAVFAGTATGSLTISSSAPISGSVSITDPDANESVVIVQTNTATSYGTFSITANGAWTYEVDLSNTAVAALNSANDTITDVISIVSFDGTTSSISITIAGIDVVANTLATFAGDLSASIANNETNEITGTVSITDPDTDESEASAQTDIATSYGTFSIATNGAWTYELDSSNNAVTALNSANDTLTDVIAFSSVDGTSSNINITISGVDVVTNTPATFSGDLTGNIANNSTNELEGTIYINDDDDGDDVAISQNNIDTSYGSFSVNADAEWEYTLDNTNTDVAALTTDSAPLTDTFTISSNDGTTVNVVITITGPEAATPIDTSFLVGDDTVPTVVCTSTVSSISALEDAAEDLVAGDTLCLADGTYSGDLELRVEGIGTQAQPITVAAENPGAAIITDGEMSIRIGGEHVIIQGLVLRDGESGSSIIKFEKETECRYCRVTEVSIIDMDNGDFDSSKWIEFYGHHNRIDHSWFSGKESRGALLVFGRWTSEEDFNANGFPADYAMIDHNYFGDRPPAWGRGYAGASDNEYEGVRIGLSTTHSAPSYTTVENNYFERIQGEAEIISNKSANNIIRNNTIRDSNGSIVTRHGEAADISNNFIFGDDNPFSGGIRLVDGEHTVTNNYIEGARFLSSNWNGGIVLTSGDGSGDTENGYQDVENILVAHNTIVDSVNSLNFFGGKEDTAPEDVYFVNNIIADAIGSVIRTNDEDMPSGTFAGNYVFGHTLSDDGTTSVSGFTFEDVMLEKDSNGLYRPSSNSPSLTADTNMDIGNYNLPTIDMDGQTRSSITTSGADETLTTTVTFAPLTAADVGPKNYTPALGRIYVQKVDIANHDFDSGDLSSWTNNGGLVVSSAVDPDDVFSRGNSLKIDSNSSNAEQTVTLTANTNYTLSAFMKGTARLAITVDGQTYAAERNASSYGFSSVSFNSGAGTSAVISAMVDNEVANKAAILNPNFDDDQDDWHVIEGTGIGQVQDSDNSATSTNGSIKFKYNDDDSGTPYDPYIAQTIDVVANEDYTFSIYQLLKSSHNGSTIRFGVFTESSDTLLSGATVLSEKHSVYADLKNVTNELDDDFFEDTITFNSGNNTSLTVFAEFNSTTGDEIRVDQFELSYLGAPSEGTEAFFDSIRLVSHPLSEAESVSAEDD